MPNKREQLVDLLEAIANVSFYAGSAATELVLRPDTTDKAQEDVLGARNLMHTLLLIVLEYFDELAVDELDLLEKILTPPKE